MNNEVSVDPRKIAAVVYDDGVAIDDLLLVFAQRLADRGVRVGGVVQLPRPPSGCGPAAPMRLRDLTTGDEFPICRDRENDGNDCCLDPAKLAHAAERIRAATESGAQLVVVSRFGKEEARGRGLRGELAGAVLAGKPVLTAVRRGMVDTWLAFAEGVGTLLDARLWVLEDWWGEFQRRPTAIS